MIATRSHTSSTSDSRCEFSSTATPRAAQVLEQLAHRPPPGRVERARRLVEQQQPRRRRSSPARSRAAAACPSTSRRRAASATSARPTSSSSSLALARAAVRAARAAGAGRAARRRSASRGSGTARRGSRAPGAPRASRPARRRSARARRSPHEPAGDLHERRLARAVGPEQPDELALADLEVDALERLGRAVATCADRRPAMRVASPSIVPDGAHGHRTAPQLGRRDACASSTRRACPARRSCSTLTRRRRHRRGDQPARRARALR